MKKQLKPIALAAIGCLVSSAAFADFNVCVARTKVSNPNIPNSYNYPANVNTQRPSLESVGTWTGHNIVLTGGSTLGSEGPIVSGTIDTSSCTSQGALNGDYTLNCQAGGYTDFAWAQLSWNGDGGMAEYERILYVDPDGSQSGDQIVSRVIQCIP